MGRSAARKQARKSLEAQRLAALNDNSQNSHDESVDNRQKNEAKNRRNNTEDMQQSDDDAISLQSEHGDEWITNNVWAEAKRKKTKAAPARKYSTLEICLLGIERIIATTRTEEFDCMPLSVIESQISLVQMYHKKFFEATVNTNAVVATQLVARNDIIQRFEQRYEEVICVLNTRLKTIQAEQSAVHNSTVTSVENSHGHQGVRVKDVDIEKFSGDIKKWPQFKSSFDECFNKRTDLSGAVKFYHLMTHLEVNSEPYEALCVYDRTDANYTAAWKSLCDMYDNERKLVNNIVLSFVDMPSVQERPSRSELISLVIKTNHLTQSLPKYGIDVKSWDPILVPLLLRKLDGESIRLWSLERNQRQIARLQPLLVFIKKRADSLDSDFVAKFGSESRAYTSVKQQPQNSTIVGKRSHFRGPDSTTSNGNEVSNEPIEKKRRLQCYHCNGLHSLYDCESFGRMSEELQEERLRSLGMCVKCLRRNHTVHQCQRANCKCGKAHSQILCMKRKKAATILAVMHQSPSVQDIDAALIATLKVFVFDEHGNKFEIRAMSDGGSHMCMVSERLVQQLKLKRMKLSIPLEGADRCEIRSNSIVNVMIAPANNGTNSGEWIQAGVLNTVSSRLPRESFDISEWNHIQGLPLADTKFNIPGDVDMLLSVEFMARIQCEGFRKDVKNNNRPIACNTSFGWVVYGALPSYQKHVSITHVAIADSQRIADNLEKLWQVDAVQEAPLLTSEEALCVEKFSSSIVRAEDGRYCVEMPIMPNPPKLGNSLKAAVARQLTNERRFRKDPKLKENYVKDLRQFIDMDHMELVPAQEIEREDGAVYYIPHHAANSDKFRVVFDGSVKTSPGGVSLNDILLNGPQIQDKLTSIIMRFRTYRIALTTDITKMYRQILVPEHQRDLLRIVWRENEKEPLKHYRLKRQTYGLKSSSFCCIATLRQCALDYKDEYPLASRAVLDSFYVDDGTTGADNTIDAEKLYQELNSMLAKGKFPLAKWTSNDKRMQEVIGSTASTVNLDLFNENSVLGITWSVRDDVFKYKLNLKGGDFPPTKRNIVASIAQLFDPNGWVSPIVVAGKILIQDIWRSNCDWDNVVSIELQRKWREIQSALIHLNDIAIPRWIGASTSCKIQIHGFADAAKKAYGTTFYTRIESSEDIRCNLVSSKTRVAPLKGMTIPRLELCAALMLARQVEEMCKVHRVSMADVTLYSDSSIVLHWLSKCPAGMKTFVGNRIAEVQELTKGAQWKHVRTHDNPADLASRGVLASELVNNSFWFHGPEWLSKREEMWPESQFTVDKRIEEATIEEQKPLQAMTIMKREIRPRIDVIDGDITESLLDRCSTMMKLVRVTARVLRFIAMKTEKKVFQSMYITRDEYLAAQNVWIKFHQRKYFAKEIEALTTNKQINRDSPILKMTPFLDGDGIMRVGGRIKRSTMPFDTKHPIILSSECRLSHLLAIEAHRNTLHGGTQLCIQYIRQRFWMCTVRKAIKRVSLKCVQCFRQRKEVATQLMGDLPESRITSGHPFECVGLDYCGPVTIKERTGKTKKHYKAYVAVFVCLKTKAVHLDLVTDLTTDAFMACLARLVSLRGSVHELRSDNATTFHGADAEIQLIHKHWTELANSEALELKQTKWKFITPLSPTQGGLWERAVRSVKHHLRRIIGAQTLTYEEYITVLAQVSACLNSRPLIALDDDPTSAEALTPAHLVLGRRLIGPLQFDYTEIPDNRLHRWRLIQKMTQDFWQQWHQEYVTNMIDRPKGREVMENITVGAVVLLKLDNMPPTHWPLAKVTDVFPGDDGNVRNVEVAIGKARYRRGIEKIAVLPIEDEGSEHSNQI